MRHGDRATFRPVSLGGRDRGVAPGAALLLTVWLVATAGRATAHPLPSAGARRFPPVAVKAALLIDRDSGRIVLAKAADRRLPPASLTKVMTALVTLESGSLRSTVTVGREAVTNRGSGLGLQPGDRLELRDLVSALLIVSANDACLALARHVGGDESGFVARMNQRAGALGLTDTHFANACGFDAPEHYSTASDLARLAVEALKNPVFAMIVRTAETEIATTDDRRRFRLANTNRLLSHPDVTGVKTGFTREAGHCLIALAFKNGKSLLLVGLDFRDPWQGATDLLRYGFDALRVENRW